ncbi:MAG: hypothetical protein MI921_29240 [Cytophagales bacterium]|nr:hypothetical protein [Cytophagales bacterium]
MINKVKSDTLTTQPATLRLVKHARESGLIGWTEANARGQAGLRCDGRREAKKAWIHFTLVFTEPTTGTLLFSV